MRHLVRQRARARCMQVLITAHLVRQRAHARATHTQQANRSVGLRRPDQQGREEHTPRRRKLECKGPFEQQ